MANIKWAPSPNYSSRNGKKIIAIVDHITAGLMPGCLSWMLNPSAKASAHYLVTRNGEIYQLVKEGDAAWHAGAVNKPSWLLYDGTNPNRYTLGIEHEGYPNEALTEAQYQATLQLHKELISKYSIPVDTEHIIGHYRIDGVNRPNCPGPMFPWDRLFNDLLGKGVQQVEVKVIVKGKEIPAKLIDNKTWVPIRELVEALAYNIDWDADTKTVIVK